MFLNITSQACGVGTGDASMKEKNYPCGVDGIVRRYQQGPQERSSLLSAKGFWLNLEGQEVAGVEQPSLSALRTCINAVVRKKR